MNITDLVKEAYETSKSKGFHDSYNGKPPPTFGDRIALMHSELSEALEEYRNGVPVGKIYYKNKHLTPMADYTDETPATEKPEGIPIELADVVIRIADFCGKYEIDLDRAIKIKLAHNKTREKRHGGKII